LNIAPRAISARSLGGSSIQSLPPQAERVCRRCGGAYPPHIRFCGRCGHTMT
jgi:hypothetical protein